MSAEKSSVVCLLFVAILLFNILSSIQLLGSGTSFIQFAMADQTVSLSTFPKADRNIFYLSANRAESLDIEVRNGSQTIAYDPQSHLPRGIWVTPESRTADRYVVHVAKNIRITENQIPATYGINFYNPNAPDQAASILLVIDSQDVASRPGPSVSFDKNSYSRGEQATLVITDPHFDCIAPDMLPDGKSIEAKIFLNGNSQPPVSISRDPNGDDQFMTTFAVPEEEGSLEAQYFSASRCVYPTESVMVRDSAQIVADSISFDRKNYAYQDSITITVTAASADVKPIGIKASKVVNGTSVPIAVDSAFASLIPDPGLAATTFTRTIPVDQIFDFGSFPNSGIVTIEATYGGDSGAQDVATVLPERETSVVIPEGRASYFTNDTASFRWTYPEWNTDPRTFDRNYVTFCSYNATSGNPIPLGRTVVTVAETGRNTGIFVNSYYISFIKPEFEIASLPEADRELFQNTTLRVLTNTSSNVLTRIGNQPCPDLLPPSTALEPVVSVNPSVKSDPDSMGRGQNIGALLHTDPPAYAISQVNCNQYNYGPDTDSDGICDNWETSSGVKVYYPAGGSSWTLSYTNDPAPKADHKDIFVEMDYVNNLGMSGCNDGRTADGNNYKPNTAAVNNVESAFRGASVDNDDGVNGVELHIYLDDPVNGSSCWGTVSIWGEDPVNPSVPTYDEIKVAQFGRDDSERLTTNKGKAKFQVFHYGLSVPRQVQDMASSGVGEQLGNDFVVSLGASGIGWSDANMGGTIMHELGHNLGLYHGGPDVSGNDYNVNCKPNYPSVMTYVRQLTNPYSNSTLKYSDDVLQTDDNGPASGSTGALTQPLIYRTDPDEDNVLKLTSNSWMGLVELVWGIDPPSGPIQILSGDSTQNPSIAGDVSKSWSDLDWDGSGGPADDSDIPPGSNIANLGISGCSGSDTNDTISGADDWANLLYNFRTLNPDAFETGFGDRQYFPLEVNTTIVTEIREKGINTIDFLLQKAEEVNFVHPPSCSDAAVNFPNGQTFELEDVINMTAADIGYNTDGGDIDEIKIKVTSTSDPVGFDLILEETAESTGIFDGSFLITAAMNVTGDRITVNDGDKVFIEYIDACEDGPTDAGSDYIISFVVGGTISDINIEVRTLPEKVRSEFHNKLVNGSLLGGQVYLQDSVTNSTLLELIARHDLATAERELLGIRKYMDGSAGGNKTDDLLAPEWEAVRALNFLDNVLASLIETNLTDSNRRDFTVVSYDANCGPDNQTFTPCKIQGFSDSVASTANTFNINVAKKRASLDLAGGGNVTLELPIQLSDNGTIYFVRSYVHGLGYDFTLPSSTNSTASVFIENLSPHPRDIALLYTPDLVSPSPIRVLDLMENPVARPVEGEQLQLASMLSNNGGWPQNFTALIEIRDLSGITVFLGWQGGELEPDGNTEMAISWIPDTSGRYSARVFVLDDDLATPEVLSLVKEAVIEVAGSN